MASQASITMTMNKRTIDRDIVDTDILPSDEILTGKAFKQRGKMRTPEGTIDYYLERIPGTEGTMEVMTDLFDYITVDCADFEFWLRDPDEDEWLLAGSGPAPIEKKHYDSDTFVF